MRKPDIDMAFEACVKASRSDWPNVELHPFKGAVTCGRPWRVLLRADGGIFDPRDGSPCFGLTAREEKYQLSARAASIRKLAALFGGDTVGDGDAPAGAASRKGWQVF